jgi:hypothetical protein
MNCWPVLVFRSVFVASLVTCCGVREPHAETDVRRASPDVRGKNAVLSTNDAGASGRSAGGGPSAPAVSTTAEKIEGQEWPQLAKGVWQLTNSVAIGEQKAKISTLKSEAYADPSWLFATYFGPGALERGGCQFGAWQTSTNQYRIETVCMVRRVGAGRLKGTIVVENPDKFRMEAELLEGKKHIHIAQTGQRISNCTH